MLLQLHHPKLNYVKYLIPPNVDNNLSPPPANRTDVSSLSVLANPIALTFALNVLVPFIDQLLVVQTYNNSSFVCASGGVRSIADIQSASYSKSEDDTLLLLKADKTQLIDSYNKSETYARYEVYTKIETNNLLNNKADNGVFYNKSENYARDEVYTKGGDDALLLLKADKIQLIDSYAKGEINNLLNNKANNGVSYSKGEDDALLLLKADKTQLIDSYIKGETDNLLNNEANQSTTYSKSEIYASDEVYIKTEDDALLLLKADKTQLIDSYTKGEVDNMLNSKANQSTTYTKIETDYIVSQINVGDVDLTDYYNKTNTDELLGEKADNDYVTANFVSTTKLSNYVTLGTIQTINANNTFNNACRFTSIIDGMSTVTGASFVKSGADNTVVLLGAGGTKPISEFITQTDDSNYVKKYGNVQDIQEIIRKTTLDQPYPEPTDDDYITIGAVKSEFVSSIYSGSINGNLIAAQFIKSDGTDQQVLLANGTTKPLSEFAGTPTDLSNYYTKTQTFSQTEANNKFVRLEGSIQQTITGRLKYVSPFDYQDEIQDPAANIYLTMSEVDAKLTNYVNTTNNQSINGTRTFNANVNAIGFAKTDKDDTSVLLAGG
ncbi:MAG: hypothetical protein EZS28_032927, partial [Streblomastix strix]